MDKTLKNPTTELILWMTHCPRGWLSKIIPSSNNEAKMLIAKPTCWMLKTMCFDWIFQSYSNSEITISRVDFLDKLMTHGPRGWLNETNRCSNVVAETIFHGRPYCASNLLNKYYCLSVAEYGTNNCGVSTFNWGEQILSLNLN